MTIMTPMAGITAPPLPGDPAAAAALSADAAAPPDETYCPEDDYPLLSSRRAAGWSAANQRLFLAALAEGHGVEIASGRVGLSAASAYAFRRTAKGAAFALGWRAATLVARDAIAETLLVRALEGQVDTVHRADGSVVTRHRHDNRLAMSLLARLDRQVETAPDADVKAARLVAQEFDAYLDLVASDAGPARAGLFLARRVSDLAAGAAGAEAAADLAPIYALAAADRFARTGVATAGEVDVTDLDPAARTGWTAEQWQRAEAAGLLALAPPPAPAPPAKTAPAPQHSQHSGRAACDAPGLSPDHDILATLPAGYEPGSALDDPVWWDEEARAWRTRFPPPDDEVPLYESGDPSRIDYERSLTESEAAVIGVPEDPDELSEAELETLAGARIRYFERLDAARDGAVAEDRPIVVRPCPPGLGRLDEDEYPVGAAAADAAAIAVPPPPAAAEPQASLAG